MAISFVNGVPGEKHRPVASHWQTLSHNVVSSTPHLEQESNSQRVIYEKKAMYLFDIVEYMHREK